MGRNQVAQIVVVGILSVCSQAAAETPVAVLSTGDAVKTTLARPLFSLSRRPDASAVQGESMPVLTGIVHYAGQDGALFKATGTPAGRVVRKGDAVAGWTLVVVTREMVTLERAGVQVVLHPDYQHHLDNEGAGHSAASGNSE